MVESGSPETGKTASPTICQDAHDSAPTVQSDRSDENVVQVDDLNSVPALSNIDPPRGGEIERHQFAGDELQQCARVLRRRITDEVYNFLISERNTLVNKRFADGLTTREENRLQMIRWELDGIEDSWAGDHLDTLEMLADIQDKLAEDVQKFSTDAARVKLGRSKREK